MDLRVDPQRQQGQAQVLAQLGGLVGAENGQADAACGGRRKPCRAPAASTLRAAFQAAGASSTSRSAVAERQASSKRPAFTRARISGSACVLFEVCIDSSPRRAIRARPVPAPGRFPCPPECTQLYGLSGHLCRAAPTLQSGVDRASPTLESCSPAGTMPPWGDSKEWTGALSHDALAAPPRGFSETIAEIWRGAARSSSSWALDEDFFELGGDSLAAVRMLAAVEDLLLAQVSFLDFIDQPTVACAGATRSQQTRGQTPPVRPGARATVRPPEPAPLLLRAGAPVVRRSARRQHRRLQRVPRRADPRPPRRRRPRVARLQEHRAAATRRCAPPFSVEDGSPVQLVDAEAAVELESHHLIAAPRIPSRAAPRHRDLASRPVRSRARAADPRAADRDSGPRTTSLQTRLSPHRSATALARRRAAGAG